MPEKTTHSPSIKDIQESTWKKLSKKKIYFGHQSVGFNIIEGLKDIMTENPQIRLNIIKTSSPSEFNTPVFAHSRVGKNRDPMTKIDAFANFMTKGIGKRADIAFFKFCYVDFGANRKTDIKDVFSYYKKSMSMLKDIYPNKTLLHFTVPLRFRIHVSKNRLNYTTWYGEKEMR